MEIEQKEIQVQVDEFGYLLVPDALSTEQVGAINDALDRDLEENDWPIKRGDGHLQDAGEHNPAVEVDILGPAGTAVFFHTALIHTARLKPNSRQRRTFHIYYGHADSPQISNYTDIPDRLRNKKDSCLPEKFYSKRRE